MSYACPVPDPEGIEKTKELYLKKYGMILSDRDASEVLALVIRHLFLTQIPSCSDTPATEENPTTTRP